MSFRLKEPLHQDFQKILRQFQKRYGKDEGTDYFWAWVNQMGLDPDRPYARLEAVMKKEAFKWAKTYFDVIKFDEEAKWYRVEALFPLSSMNDNIYTEAELAAATRTLIGASVNLNHMSYDQTAGYFKGVSIEDAEYEDGCAEVLLRVQNGAGKKLGLNLQKMIDDGDIIHVSIEADCLRGWSWSQEPSGWVCRGLHFSGLALLTKDVLPGVPLTRIMPVEKLFESVIVTEMKEKKVAEEKKEHIAEKPEESSEAASKKDENDGTDVSVKTVADLKFQITELKRKLRSAEEARKAAEGQSTIKEESVQKLEGEVDKLERKNETLKAQLQTSKEAHDSVLHDLNSATSRYTNAEKKLEKVEAEHKSLISRMEETQELLQKEQDAHFSEASKNLHLTQELTTRNNEILRLEDAVKDMQEKLKKAKRVGRILVKV